MSEGDLIRITVETWTGEERLTYTPTVLYAGSRSMDEATSDDIHKRLTEHMEVR